MAAVLPVPIEFRMPDEWRAVPPDEAGAPGTAFVALIPGPDRGFTANVTIDGEFRPEPIPLDVLADSSIAALSEATGAEVTVLTRAEVGTDRAPALTQTLGLVDDQNRQLVQAQVYLSMPDVVEPSRRAVIRLILTATAEQHRSVLPDFQWFVSTVRPDQTG